MSVGASDGMTTRMGAQDMPSIGRTKNLVLRLDAPTDKVSGEPSGGVRVDQDLLHSQLVVSATC